MKQRWRYLNGTELYDLGSDPAQQHDVAAEHPQVVAEFVRRTNSGGRACNPHFCKYGHIVVGSEHENSTRINCMDWHAPSVREIPWNQPQVEQMLTVNGWWMLDVAQPGRYAVTLRHQPPQAAYPLQATTARVKLGAVEAVASMARPAGCGTKAGSAPSKSSPVRPPFPRTTADAAAVGDRVRRFPRSAAGRPRPSAALADYLARAATPRSTSSATTSTPTFAGPPGVTSTASAAVRADLLGSRGCPGRPGRRPAGRPPSRPDARVVVNGGNCRWADINWVHYVHAAFAPDLPPAAAGAAEGGGRPAAGSAAASGGGCGPPAWSSPTPSGRPRRRGPGVGVPARAGPTVYYGGDPDLAPRRPRTSAPPAAWLGSRRPAGRGVRRRLGRRRAQGVRHAVRSVAAAVPRPAVGRRAGRGRRRHGGRPRSPTRSRPRGLTDRCAARVHRPRLRPAGRGRPAGQPGPVRAVRPERAGGGLPRRAGARSAVAGVGRGVPAGPGRRRSCRTRTTPAELAGRLRAMAGGRGGVARRGSRGPPAGAVTCGAGAGTTWPARSCMGPSGRGMTRRPAGGVRGQRRAEFGHGRSGRPRSPSGSPAGLPEPVSVYRDGGKARSAGWMLRRPRPPAGRLLRARPRRRRGGRRRAVQAPTGTPFVIDTGDAVVELGRALGRGPVGHGRDPGDGSVRAAGGRRGRRPRQLPPRSCSPAAGSRPTSSPTGWRSISSPRATAAAPAARPLHGRPGRQLRSGCRPGGRATAGNWSSWSASSERPPGPRGDDRRRVRHRGAEARARSTGSPTGSSSPAGCPTAELPAWLRRSTCASRRRRTT